LNTTSLANLAASCATFFKSSSRQQVLYFKKLFDYKLREKNNILILLQDVPTFSLS
jgi:hypothetical protein